MASLCMVSNRIRFSPCTSSLPGGKKYDDADGGIVSRLQMY